MGGDCRLPAMMPDTCVPWLQPTKFDGQGKPLSVTLVADTPPGHNEYDVTDPTVNVLEKQASATT